MITYASGMHTSACGLPQQRLPPLDVTEALCSYVLTPWWKVRTVSLAHTPIKDADTPALQHSQ